MRLPQRQCLILLGEDSWLTEQARAVYQQAADAPCCWLSDAKDRPADAISSKQAGQQLGRSNHLIIFDGRTRFSADAFGALIGSLRAGGLMLVLLSAGRQPSLWLQRFLRRAAGHAGIEVIRQAEGLAPITLPAVSAGKSPVVPTADQEQAINAVIRVVSGHRRRPLVIASDRGRGKTALLGMAAAELLKQDKQTILVTAPSINNITPLFQHADAQLPGALWDEKSLSWQQGRIVFIAPDALLEERPAADCLIIDEAAAIPSQMLTRMLKAYSRIVFATTLHGYEGTGRGFALRFRKTLDTLTPNWRFCELHQPVRWADDDRLELFSFDALLLDAEPAADRLVEHATLEQAQFELIKADSFSTDETLLREVFGLMVLAHYRTRPGDLQMLLEQEDISIALLRYQGWVIASAWLVDEPPLSDALAAAVFNGSRRLKGRLLPQSLLAHAGITDAGQYHYQRIIRIAVHPALQGRGFGRLLLAEVEQHSAQTQDLLGTSFAMETDLCRFWLQNGYHPVRLGQHQDEVTGSVAVMMLKALSSQGQRLLKVAQQGLRQQWPFLLHTQLAALPPSLISVLLPALADGEKQLPAALMHTVVSFAHSQRSYESSQFALWQWLQTDQAISAFQQLDAYQQTLLVELVMQQQALDRVVKQLELNGRAQLIKMLRQTLASMLSSAQRQ